jgi:DNA-binding FadR family transcriptional regulator
MGRDQARALRENVLSDSESAPTSRRPSPKLAEKVASDIERDILAMGWQVGTVVGSEKELLEKHGVSRGILREAIRLLEHHMVATMRRGPGGGLIVTAPDAEVVTGSVAMFLEYRQATPPIIFEARKALELVAVEMTAQRIDETKISQLRDLTRRDDSLAEYPQSGLHWHIVVAEMTGNPALALFVTSLVRLTDEAVSQFRVSRAGSNPEVVHHAHSRITEAIIAGDIGLARHRMLRHLEAVEAFISERWPDQGPWPRGAPSSPPQL